METTFPNTQQQNLTFNAKTVRYKASPRGDLRTTTGNRGAARATAKLNIRGFLVATVRFDEDFQSRSFAGRLVWGTFDYFCRSYTSRDAS